VLAIDERDFHAIAVELRHATGRAERSNLAIDLAIDARHHFGSLRQRDRGGIDVAEAAES
jgi:hypothetical protein